MIMSSNFDEALDHTLHWEGGYSNDPHDPGGPTNLGITWKTLTRWRITHPDFPKLVKDLTHDQARTIYHEWYWLLAQCHRLSLPLALALFDMAVNQGPRTASRTLQRTLRVQADGVIGPKTLAAIDKRTIKAILLEFHARRVIQYTGLMKFIRYGRGWVRRVLDTYHVAMLVELEK